MDIYILFLLFLLTIENIKDGNELYLVMTDEATLCRLVGAWQVPSYR